MTNLKVILAFVLIFFVFSIQSIQAANDKKQKRQLPRTYPYSYPYDEHHCPTGNCSRKNENPKQSDREKKQGRDRDDD
ncbi:MAG: hypothetical protein QM479_13345 [Pseudomonadota bacterium]